MLQIIYGVPGSGKSYYAVWNIKRTLEKDKDNVVIISNIENLKLSHLNLDDLINKYGGIDGFFNVECQYWKQDIEKRKILFIDEAQRYFNKKFFSNAVFFFFQYHRHLNIDIYLITQSYKTLPTELVVLSELVIQAVPSSFRWFKNSFKYLVKDLETFETVEKIDIPFKKEIAYLYTSALVIQNNNKMTYTQKYIFFSVLIVAVALVLLVFVFPKLLFKSLPSFSDNKSNANNNIVESNNQLNNNLAFNDIDKLNNDIDKFISNLKQDGFFYPSSIPSKGYMIKKISNGEFLNKYRNGVVYDLSVNNIKVYDDAGNVKAVYLIKDIPSSSGSENLSSDISN